MNEFKDEMIDILEKIGNGSVVHHGKSNDRIYLMKLMEADHLHITELLEELALRHGYSKIFCKIPAKVAPLFIVSGFLIEGYIPCFYKGEEGAFFVSRFLSSDRAKLLSISAMQFFLNLLQTSIKTKSPLKKENIYTVRRLGKENADTMAKIYALVFESYPFPIHDPMYLIKTMDENIQYFGAFKNEQLVALASSEIDAEALNAEMTDFATHPQHTGHSLSRLLLTSMEQAMKEQGIKTLYSIVRLNSIPMNKTFLGSGYSYSGTLLNNTQIAGNIECMNLYYKL